MKRNGSSYSWLSITQIRRGTRQLLGWNTNLFKAMEVRTESSRGINLSVYLIIKLVCVKGRTCLRMAIPAYCFNIFESIFGVLFSLLIRKLILGCKTIWQSMRKFLWAVWSVSTFPHMGKEETFLSWKLHISMVWIFYTFSLELKIST